ncbi:ergothioneine biosynthesis protein EgtB [Terricaulis sp.]|uniref:ergothioneine biosynthesis protein EgtB n=1 Tax=Terricaulis sp. TaxID=2768686 RepID=UPI002AC558C2|nr:ergothioneine biosynthesis protein EgtB [Terricaulis sp.]MDZ4690744.1 ergothioneine biosynthesis protein EgtB [Terricaulis sp.]
MAAVARAPTRVEPSERTDACRAYHTIRRQSERLTEPLSTEDQLLQSMPDASPTKWHLAHTAWFFEEFVLGAYAPGYARFDADFGFLFNSYYEAVGPRHPRPERGMLSRPSLDTVHAYRRHVDQAMVSLIMTTGADCWTKARPLIELGLHHEQQHQELILMDIKHALSRNPLKPAYAPPTPRHRAEHAQTWHAIPGGLCLVGAKSDGFAFDNERPLHKTWIEPFRLASRPVTNAEYRAFIDDGGYKHAAFWLADAWRIVGERDWRAPLYWSDDFSVHFTLAGEQPIDPAGPVCHLSFYEADAYARWAGKRLPREEEWEVAVSSADAQANFVSAGALHPQPAPAGALVQMFGDVWEWTASPYVGYPGFRSASGAVGEYNGKFMCGQFVLRGGSAVTPEGHVRPTYRNFFPPDARWAFSGVRLADDNA